MGGRRRLLRHAGKRGKLASGCLRSSSAARLSHTSSLRTGRSRRGARHHNPARFHGRKLGLKRLHAGRKRLERQVGLGTRHPRERHLKVEALISGGAQGVLKTAEQVKNVREAIGPTELGGLGHELLGPRRVAQRTLAGHGGHVDVAHVAREVAHVLLDVHAARAHLVHAGEAPGHIASGHKLGHARERVVGHLAEQLAGVFHAHGAAAVHRERLERRQGVAQAAARMAGDEGQRLTVVLEALGGAHELKALGDVGVGDAVELQALAARKHRLGNLLRVGGAQHEHHVRRRLLQRLEQRVERRRGEHVDLVDHIDLVAALRGGKGDSVDDLVTHVVDAGARRGVELVHIGVRAARDLLALLARAVRMGRGGTAARLAHEGLGQKARRSGLTGAARAREEVGMSHAPVRQGVLQGRDDMLLSHHALKRLRAVLAIQRLHASSLGVRCAVLVPTSVRHSAPNSVENRWYATASACPADPPANTPSHEEAPVHPGSTTLPAPLPSHKKAPPAPSASGARKAWGQTYLVRLSVLRAMTSPTDWMT